jgi:type II secretory pathway pseudopilin PulG
MRNFSAKGRSSSGRKFSKGFILSKVEGFSLIEVIVVIGTITLLFSFVSVNLLSVRQKATTSTSADTLISDIRTQQLKAMVGDGEGVGGADRYGLHFDSSSYTFFRGSTYNPSDPSNFTIELSETVAVTNNTLPSGNVIFEKGSGEIVGFVNGQDSVSLRNTETNEERVIEFNSVGTLVRVK